MTTTIDRAEQVIHGLVDHPETPEIVAQALAHAGLLIPGPQIIRTREELAALDPNTLLAERRDAWGYTLLEAGDWMEECGIDTEGIFPLAVVASGEQVRASQQSLDGTE